MNKKIKFTDSNTTGKVYVSATKTFLAQCMRNNQA